MRTSMKTLNPCLCWLAAAAFFCGGCSFPQRPPEKINTYLLSISLPDAPSPVRTPYCFSIRPCRAAAAFSTKSLVYRTGSVEYKKDFYNQFLITPAEEVIQTLSNWIAAMEWTACVPGTAPKDFYTIVPVLDEIYGDFQDSTNPFTIVKMQISLTFTDSTCRCTRTLFSKPYQARILMSKSTANEWIKAYSRGFEKIFTDFQKDLESTIDSKS